MRWNVHIFSNVCERVHFEKWVSDHLTNLHCLTPRRPANWHWVATLMPTSVYVVCKKIDDYCLAAHDAPFISFIAWKCHFYHRQCSTTSRLNWLHSPFHDSIQTTDLTHRVTPQENRKEKTITVIRQISSGQQLVVSLISNQRQWFSRFSIVNSLSKSRRIHERWGEKIEW